MSVPVADDFEAINKRIREIEWEEKGEAPKQEAPQISPAEQEPVYWGDGAGVYEAAMLEGFNAVLIEREDEYIADINRRIERATEERTTIITTAQLDMFA